MRVKLIMNCTLISFPVCNNLKYNSADMNRIIQPALVPGICMRPVSPVFQNAGQVYSGIGPHTHIRLNNYSCHLTTHLTVAVLDRPVEVKAFRRAT